MREEIADRYLLRRVSSLTRVFDVYLHKFLDFVLLAL